LNQNHWCLPLRPQEQTSPSRRASPARHDHISETAAHSAAPDPGQTGNGKAAWFYTIAPELRVQSNWSRHELKADLRGSYIAYSPDETPSLNRPYVNGRVDGRIDVTHDTRVDLAGRILVSTDNPGSPNLQAGLAKLPIYVTGGGTVGVGQHFNRFDVSIKGDVERTVYQQSQLTDGSTSSNDDRNYDQYAGKLRGSYELSPSLIPFAEIIGDTRVHDLNTDSSGYQRNSNGLTGRSVRNSSSAGCSRARLQSGIRAVSTRIRGWKISVA
jgi:hypothetical protein